MEVYVKLNNKAFTLIELLVSMVIMLIVFLALAKSLIFYTHHNAITSLRNEAVKTAQDCLEEIRTGESCKNNITMSYRGYKVDFKVTANPPSLSTGVNNVSVSVSYTYLNKNFSYNLTTVVYKDE
jgi:prepilin-type N-terminal cleavage/methylation domain-containing protein